jgi:hypothetical protein
MLDDAFALTIDPIYELRRNTSHFPVGNWCDKENLFDLLLDLKK